MQENIHKRECIYKQYDNMSTEDINAALEKTLDEIKEIEKSLKECKGIADPMKVWKLRDLKREVSVLKLKSKSSKIQILSTGASSRKARRHPDIDALAIKKRGSAHTRPKKRRKKR